MEAKNRPKLEILPAAGRICISKLAIMLIYILSKNSPAALGFWFLSLGTKKQRGRGKEKIESEFDNTKAHTDCSVCGNGADLHGRNRQCNGPKRLKSPRHYDDQRKSSDHTVDYWFHAFSLRNKGKCHGQRKI